MILSQKVWKVLNYLASKKRTIIKVVLQTTMWPRHTHHYINLPSHESVGKMEQWTKHINTTEWQTIHAVAIRRPQEEQKLRWYTFKIRSENNTFFLCYQLLCYLQNGSWSSKPALKYKAWHWRRLSLCRVSKDLTSTRLVKMLSIKLLSRQEIPVFYINIPCSLILMITSIFETCIYSFNLIR